MAQQEHQEYIQQKVNPILENLVTQLLLERPEQLAPFMIKWLSEHAKTPDARALTEGVNELQELKAELEKLQAEVKSLEAEVGEKGGGDKGKDDDASEEEEEEDDTEDIAPPPAHLLKKGPRASVSAEAYGAWNQQKEYQAPVYAKTDDQKQRIRAILQESFLFASLENEALGIIVDAMQEKVVDKDTRMINQGDDGDFMYVVESGLMNCLKKSADGEDKVVKECRAGDAFGELALLYNCPRAASVVAAEKAVLWQLDRESFNHIVREAASKRRGRYEDFLKSVPILKTMENYEMQLMCDALQSVTFKQDELIVKQGDSGDRFFILEEGKCVVTKVYVEGTPPQEVMSYSSGDYFGELALLMNEPRAASVTALTDCRLLTLSRRTFKTLLGPLEDMLKRNASQYK